LKLLYTPIRDYIHTVEAVVNYAGLRALVEPVPTRPYEQDTELPSVNPIGKVPTLVLDDGEYLAGGPVIYEYLDSLHERRPLHPPAGRRRYTVLRQAWMADALFDQLVLLIVEGWLYRDAQRRDHIRRCWSKVTGILDQMEVDSGGYGELDIGQVRGIGALTFMDLKMPQVGAEVAGMDAAYDWRAGRPGLTAWFARLSADAVFREPLLPWD
jgi:glutathione S-transferase